MPANYYDVVLLIVPLLLFGGGSLSLIGLPLETTITVGAGLAALLIGHAMFIRGPVPSTRDAPPDRNRPLSP